jgi:beta-lactamase class C
MRSQAIAGMVLAWAEGDAPPMTLTLGSDAAGRSLAGDTLFPVASITKLATALAVLRLAAAGVLAIDDPIERHLPDAAAADHSITLATLLSHTAGMPFDLAAGAAPYAPGLDWPALGRACLATRPAWRPHLRVVYSNVGVGLLALVVERLSGQPFPAALANLVLKPLGIAGTLGEEPARAPARIASDLGEHTGTRLEALNSPFWRSLALPWGGLVTDAAGALALVRAYAGRPAGFLPPALRAAATQDQSGGVGGGLFGLPPWPRCAWGLGAEVRGDKTPHYTPAAASPRSFGHVGGSGCIAWADPDAGLAWAILGTRTFYAWWPRMGEIATALYP